MKNTWTRALQRMQSPPLSRFESAQVKRALAAFLSLLTLSFAVHAAEPPALKAGVFDPPRMAPDFSLRGSDGTELKLSRYRGKVVALGFGYTSCADVCPTTLAQLAA